MEEQSKIHVAFADDHTVMRDAVVSILESTGNIIVDFVADDGQILLNKLQTAEVLPDVCIIDLSMPVMDGYEALKAIRKRWPQMKALILTGYSSEQYVIRMIQAGANGYLLKKCSQKEINDAITSIHLNDYYYSESANKTLFHLAKTNAIKMPQISDIEVEFLKYCCSDLSLNQIAEKMKTTLNSVEGCRNRLFNKLDVTSRPGLILFAFAFGYVPIEVNRTGSKIISPAKSK